MNENELTVYLLRHGQTSMNADSNRYCGLTDVELTKLGKQQAVNTGLLLKDIVFDAVYASPLQRSKETARLLNLPNEVQVDPSLTEIDFGSWEGKTREEFITQDPQSWENWNENPLIYPAGGTGETAQSVIERVERFYKQAKEKHMGKNILIVGHNGINRIFLAHMLGMPIRNYRSILQENSCITLFTIDTKGEFQLQKLNCRG